MFTIRKSVIREPVHFQRDRDRHKQKVLDLLKANPANLDEILAEEDIIRLSPGKSIKVSVRGLIEYQFQFDDRAPRVGQTSGDPKKGQRIRTGPRVSQQGLQGPGAGDEPGLDIYETEVPMKDLAELIEEEFELPDLKEKSHDKTLKHQKRGFQGTKKTGIRAHIEKRKTVRERLKRKKKIERGEIQE